MSRIQTTAFYKNDDFFESLKKTFLEPFIYNQFFYEHIDCKNVYDDISSRESELSHYDKADIVYQYVPFSDQVFPLFEQRSKIVIKEAKDGITYKSFKEKIISNADYKEVFPGNSTAVEEIIHDAFSQERSETVLDWLNKIFLEASESKAVIANLLFAVSHLEYEEVYPVGPTLAMLVLNNPNCTLVELAIHAFENWNSKDSIKYLKSYKPDDILNRKDWDRVIKYLEENGD